MKILRPSPVNTIDGTSLRCVDYIVPFDSDSPINIMKRLKPNIYVKGGDYTLDTINQQERSYLESIGARIVFSDYKHDYSARNFVTKVQAVRFVN